MFRKITLVATTTLEQSASETHCFEYGWKTDLQNLSFEQASSRSTPPRRLQKASQVTTQVLVDVDFALQSAAAAIAARSVDVVVVEHMYCVGKASTTPLNACRDDKSECASTAQLGEIFVLCRATDAWQRHYVPWSWQ